MNDNTMMLTIFLKHDQTKSLAEINEKLDEPGFWLTFPPKGVEVVSWNVVMGICQVVILRFPAENLRSATLPSRQWLGALSKPNFTPSMTSPRSPKELGRKNKITQKPDQEILR